MSKPLQLLHTLLSPVLLHHTHRDPDKFQTISNEAYNTVVQGKADPTTSSSQPATAAADYEPV